MKNTMKTLMLTAAAVAIGISTAGAVQAADGYNNDGMWSDHNVYLSIGGGWNYQSGQEFKANGRDAVDFDSGFLGEIALGHVWGKTHFGDNRTEIEGSYRYNDVNSVKGTGSAGNRGDFYSYDAMLNEYYDFNTNTRWTPYLGAGVGASFQNARHIGGAFGPANGINDSATEFAYQGIVGIDYATTQHSTWGLRYDYLGTTRGKFDTNTGEARNEGTNNHSVLVTYRYTWGNNPAPMAEPRAAAPMHAPAPQPVAYAVPTEQQIEDSPYKIFFANDSYKLTNNGRQVIHDAAQAAGNQHAVMLDLTSNTDTTGTQAHNDRLSAQRSQAVRKALLSEGVSDSMIHVVSNAERDLPVPTADHVKEPRNRVVTIVLQ